MDADSPNSSGVDEGIVQAIYDYDGRWVTPSTYEPAEDDYSEDSFA